MEAFVFGQDVLIMIKNDFADCTPVARTEIITVSFADVIHVSIEPLLALSFTLSRMNVRRFLPLVAVEK